MNFSDSYEVIIVGGGHAGTEAALATARMGLRTLLITHNIETLGQMSCNPAFGGIGKGHLIKEVDAMGGIPAIAVDHAGIHFRILNASKGAAVQATRAQTDRMLYKQYIRQTLENQPNLSIFQQAVDDIIIENHRVAGVVTQSGLAFSAKAIVLTAGTFLSGKIHIGDKNFAGGRAGDPPSIRLAEKLRELNLRVGRLKTGTPPRIDGKSIDYTHLQSQPGDDPVPVFSFMGTREMHPQQVLCHITHTNEKTHEIIREHIHLSAMYSGAIEGIGPRYCPSIEDKINRFAEKNSHQIFIEPEGLTTNEIYPNGVSTSLPYEVQLKFIRSIKGFENAHITRPGYAIEYDFFDPRDLKFSLETKAIAGLFFAGQINGTTGYEEAAAQGLIAGINAARMVQEKEPWYPRRDEAYMGVLLDDLITQGTQEPYRMFTSRAEYRLLLREDNADLRLTAKAHELGLIDENRWRAFNEKMDLIAKEQQRLKQLWITPHSEAGKFFQLQHEVNGFDLLKRPEINYSSLITKIGEGIKHQAAAEQIEIQAKYAGYIARQKDEVERQRKLEHTQLPKNFDYLAIKGLSIEIQQKLNQQKPETIGQASRIPGMTPAAISLLLVYLKKYSIKDVHDEIA